MNRRELLGKVGNVVKQKATDPVVQQGVRKKAKETAIRKELDSVHGIEKPTQNIIEDMVDLGDKGEDIISRKEFLNKATDRAFKRNASNRAIDVVDSAAGKAGAMIKVVKNIGKKLRGKFSYMDDLVRF